MRDAGYTLVECLAAMAILSLGSLGLLRCVQLLSEQQARLAQSAAAARDLRQAQTALDRLLAPVGPFRSHQPERLAGSPQGFSFACDQADPCRVSLVSEDSGLALKIDDGDRSRVLALHDVGPGRFVYRGRLGPSDVWPPQRPERQALRAIAVVSDAPGAPAALLQSAIWAEQPAVCAFDPVLQDCR